MNLVLADGTPCTFIQYVGDAVKVTYISPDNIATIAVLSKADVYIT